MGHLTKSGDISGCHNSESAIGIEEVEARRAAKHPSMHSSVSFYKEFSSQKNVSIAETEKL